MKADTVDLATIFGQNVHYVVPLYQRPYVWTREQQWELLWEDVRAVAERQLDSVSVNDTIPHFLGAVVLEQSLNQVGMIGARTVIDGQQRLTTLQLMIAAARSLAAERSLDGPRQMFDKLLLNDEFLVRNSGDQFKVFPTQRDQVAFREAVASGVVAASGAHRMHEAYRFFRVSIDEWATEGGDASQYGQRLEGLSTAIWKRLVLVTIDLDPGDNAQIIFETLNARGTPLLAADLIKNHLFQTALQQGDQIDPLFDEYWKLLDTDWWRAEIQQGRLRRPRLDVFLNHWLAMSTGREVVTHLLFPEFKRYLAAGEKRAADVLADVARYGAVYEAFENEPRTTELGKFLYRLNTMEVSTAYPVLLWLLGPGGISDASERTKALAAVESWLVRRLLTRQTTKNYNNVFLGLLKAAREAAVARGSGPIAADVVDHLVGLTGESQFWPSAVMVRSTLRTLPAYTVLPRSRLRMVLEGLEEGMRSGLTENVSLPTDLTVEHVLPQEWTQNWPLPDGIDPVQGRLDREDAKHRIGNLTLVTGRLNPKMSNSAWPDKQAALREHSVMRISADIRNADGWDERAIAERSDRLASVAVSVWPRPADTDDEAAGLSALESPTSRPSGPPDPENPDAFAAVLAVGDEVGVGPQLRRIIEVSREIGLYPRPDRYSVMISPPADKRVYLITVWPQRDEGGSFRMWKSPAAFARWLPGVTLEAAQSALGSSEEAGVLLAQDTEALLSVVRELVPSDWLAESFDDRRAALLALGIDGLEKVPDGVLRLIDHRSGGDPQVALRFARAALNFDGVSLRPQQSKGDPWYFQVRHPKFGQVVAYASPRPGEIRVEYRLPSTSDTYGLAIGRDSFHGIVLTARDDDGLRVATRLLRDALARDP
jgi:hypothetical protein